MNPIAAALLFGGESGGSSDPIVASSVTYDGTSSGLSSENVQEAIDEVNEKISKSIPRLYITGTIPTTKTYNDCSIVYDNGIETKTLYAKIKCQGTSSMSYPKKNFTVKFYKDDDRLLEENVEMKKGWGKHSEYCLKANYIDHSHMRNIVSANLWSRIVETRSDYEELPQEIKNTYGHGSIDGFPIKLYANDTYEGVYTLNIPKADWLFGMDKNNENHIVLCAETNSTSATQKTACNFKKEWSGVDGEDWSIEVGTNSERLVASLNALILIKTINSNS